MISDLQIAKKLINISNSARSRDYDFNLTFPDMKKLLTVKRCFYTGDILNEIKGHNLKRTIDRVDNEKGYIKGNVVACTKEFNLIKGYLTIPQLKMIVAGMKRKKLWN